MALRWPRKKFKLEPWLFPMEKANPFHPLQLGDSTIAYFDGTNLGAVSSTITQWDDQSGNDHHAAQNSAGSEPLVKTDPLGNGVKCCWNDGVDDYLDSRPYFGGNWQSDDYVLDGLTLMACVYRDTALPYYDHNKTWISVSKTTGSYIDNGGVLRSFAHEADPSNFSGTYNFYCHGSGYVADQVYQSGDRVTGSGNGNSDTGVVAVTVMDFSAGSMTMYVLDGEGLLKKTQSGLTTGTPTVGYLRLWGDGGGNNPLLPIYGAAFGAWEGAIGDADAISLLEYCNTNYFGGNLGATS